MRHAEIEKNWSTAYKRNYSTTIEKLALTNFSPFRSAELTLTGGLTAICGANGVGKTTLIHILRRLLLNEPLTGRHLRQTEATSATLYLRSSDGVFTKPSGGADNVAGDIPFGWIDSIRTYADHQEFFSKLGELDDLIEGLEPWVADKTYVDRARYILRRNYSKVHIFELEEFSSDDEPLPFIEVESDGVIYDSRSMGLGELAILVILWKLHHLQEGAILLIEEPESFLAPFSQVALLNILSSCSACSGVRIIFTTHSPDMLRRIPLDHVRILVRSGADTLFKTPTRDAELRDLLGVESPTKGIFFVEDTAAKLFLSALLEHISFRRGREFEIVAAGSDGQIYEVLRKIPSEVSRLRFVGILDGGIDIPKGVKWPCVVLPGGLAPEIVLKNAAIAQSQRLADLTHRQHIDIQAILSTLTGLDHHDWVVEFARRLGLGYEQAFMLLFDSWLLTDGNRDEAESFSLKLSSVLVED